MTTAPTRAASAEEAPTTERGPASIPLDLDGETVALEGDGLPPTRHRYERRSILLANAALTIGRPLLLRGEPGSGKSQLARALAQALGWAYASITLDARSEAADLGWEYDAVRRLATAQVLGAAGRGMSVEDLDRHLEVMKFVEPRPLWWAFNWGDAKEQYGDAKRPVPQVDEARAAEGWVVLLDEMDKADPSVPNGLLDVLGHGELRKPNGEILRPQARGRMLVVVTTNEERPLPNAFLRRCLVMRMGPQPGEDLRDWLRTRARAHHPPDSALPLSDAILDRATDELLKYRDKVEAEGLNPPGLAELVDLLRAVVDQCEPGDEEAQRKLLDELAPFALLKHPLEGAPR